MEAREKREITTNDNRMPDWDSEMNSEVGTENKTGISHLVAKRCFDFLASLAVTLLCCSPLAVLAFLVAIKDFGNPFDVQKRVGKDGKDLFVAEIRPMRLYC